MMPLEKQPLQTFTMFVEEESGVLEFIIGVFDEGEKRSLLPVAARVVSGTFEKLPNDRFQQALETHRWAQSHASIFSDARVIYDR
jgi:hypothetical protein